MSEIKGAIVKRLICWVVGHRWYRDLSYELRFMLIERCTRCGRVR